MQHCIKLFILFFFPCSEISLFIFFDYFRNSEQQIEREYHYLQCLILLVLLTDFTCNLLFVSHIMYMQPRMCCKILLLLCRSKLNGRIYFAGQNNCYFDSIVKNTNMPQKSFATPFSFDRHNITILFEKDNYTHLYISYFFQGKFRRQSERH